MKGRVSDKERLIHILDSINLLEDFTSGVDYKTYNEDLKLRLAIVKLLEIIGEASNGLSDDIQKRFTTVDWSVLKGIRNVLVNEYFGIDYNIIWDTIKKSIPELKNKISEIVSQL
jgi:uncharacterized protein with HEPN domain